MKTYFITTRKVKALAVGVFFCVAMAAPASFGGSTIPIHRFYTGNGDGVHRYSRSAISEGAKYEGIAFYVSPAPLPYTVPLYHLYSQKLSDSFYTVNLDVRNHCISKLGYQDLGILGHVLPVEKDIPGSAPLHRWVRAFKWEGLVMGGGTQIVKRNFQDHFYMTSAPNVPNYSYEGQEARVWTEKVELPNRFIEMTSPAAGGSLQVAEPVITWNIWSSGGSVRISYSTDNGGSWQPIATVPNSGAYGLMNKRSYNGWKVPANLAGRILIRVDWIMGEFLLGPPGGVGISSNPDPWATDMNGNISIVRRVDMRVRPEVIRRPNRPPLSMVKP